MPFKYDKLWILLDEQRMTRSELREKIGISQSTIVNMGKNKCVSLTVIDKICKELKCTPNSVIEFVPFDNAIVLSDNDCLMSNKAIGDINNVIEILQTIKNKVTN